MKYYISPVAIDLGAAHTGVYSAFYKNGSKPDAIEKHGIVYNLETDAYTLLMTKRTATRHQRRGFDRRQMAKRLFKLIWEQKFKLSWDDDLAQTIGFLFNRRGFNFISEEYDKDALAQFSQEAWEELPKTVQKQLSPKLGKNSEWVDLEGAVAQLAQDRAELEKILKNINKKPREISKDIVYYGATTNLAAACEALIDGDSLPVAKGKKKESPLKFVSAWIVDRWTREDVVGMHAVSKERNNCDIAEHLQNKSLRSVKSVLSSLPDYSAKEKRHKDSVWNFKAEKFNLEKAVFDYAEDASEKEKRENVKTHLHHLAYALDKTYKELTSGGRHRSTYFEEVADVLNSKKHTHGYLKRFCKKLHKGEYKNLDAQKLKNLVGHISNLELKPLRKYFNDEKHRKADYWDEERLGRYFNNWIIKEWRVNPDKGKGRLQDYRSLCAKLRKHTRGTVAFWIKQDPVATIPPYQDNNNRRPPRCQSLILNADYLSKVYPKWPKWLTALTKTVGDHIEDLEQVFLSLKSGKGNSYFSDNLTGALVNDSQKLTLTDLDARLLQFILDRRKAADPLLLNEIYSRTKKLRQLASQKKLSATERSEKKKQREKLKKALEESRLPKRFKVDPDFKRDDIFPEGSFLHLICGYYKARQRARDGRLFIHPDYVETKSRGYEFRNRFDSEDLLLTYCNRKPRQKKYQMLSDVAGVLQVNPALLRDLVDTSEEDNVDEAVFTWLKGFHGLMARCGAAAEAQKEHRGQLKIILLSGKDKKLSKLKKQCEDLSLKIAAALYVDEEAIEQHAQKFQSIFSFAQLHNIAFVERSGNANTCPVCSLDNSRRMEPGKDLDGARAQRLPAMPTRIIDGAVKRMARIIGKKIAEDRWPKIEAALKGGARVTVPIITESNRFEFEPKLAVLKSKPTKKGDELKDQSFENKTKRIGDSGQNICPYAGRAVGTTGELDHIIPRASGYGTMNDEANLILATQNGNKKKGKRVYALGDLSPKYKKIIFDVKSDEQISKWIHETIWDEARGDFTFGNYNSFINLDPNQQKAFRHALFLVSDPLREKVISAINNRNRAFVNGTQRFFAQVLANELHKKALGIKKERLLDFDFFAVEATSGSRGDGIKDWRRHYEDAYGELNAYIKQGGEKQKAYSHLLDAQIAFVLTAHKHRGDGSLRLNIPQDKGLVAFDADTGEFFKNNLFADIWVKPEQMDAPHTLERRKPNDKQFLHRSFTRDTFYADRYLPILIKQAGEGVTVKAGFDWTNSGVWKQNKKNREQFTQLLPLFAQGEHYPKNLLEILSEQDNDSTILMEQRLYELLIKRKYFRDQEQRRGYIYLTIDRKALHEFWMEHHNTKTGEPFDDLFELCYKKLGYRTEKKSIAEEKDLNIDMDKKFKVTFGDNKNIILPYQKDWERLINAWGDAQKRGDKFDEFLRQHFLNSGDGGKRLSHQKTRKVFSLPIKTEQGKIMLRRKGWNGDQTFQIINDSDSRSVENKPIAPVLTSEGKIEESLAPWTKSSNFVKLQKKEYSDGTPADPTRWFLITDKTNYPKGVDKVWLRIDNKTSPSVAIRLAVDASKLDPSKTMGGQLCGHGFRKQDAKKARGNNPQTPSKTPDEVMIETFWDKDVKTKKKGDIIIYKGSIGYTGKRKPALSSAKPVAKLE